MQTTASVCVDAEKFEHARMAAGNVYGRTASENRLGVLQMWDTDVP